MMFTYSEQDLPILERGSLNMGNPVCEKAANALLEGSI